MKPFINVDKQQSASPEIPEGYEEFPVTLKSISTQPLSIGFFPNYYTEATVNTTSKSVKVLVQVGNSPDEEVIKKGNDLISGKYLATIVTSGTPLVTKK